MAEFMQLLAIVVPVCAVVICTMLQNVKIREVHVLVNSRLQEALNEIFTLKKTIDDIKRGGH